MYNVNRLFVINSNKASGFTSSTRTEFVLKLEGNMLDLKVLKGRDPYEEEVFYALGKIAEEAGITRYERKVRYRFANKVGMSGCCTTYIEYEEVEGFPHRKPIFYTSCFDKASLMKYNFVYDLLDLGRALKYLEIKNGKYAWSGTLSEGTTVKVVKPRILGEEDGWCWGWEAPKKPVPLSIVREHEQADDAEDTDAEDTDDWAE